MIVRTYVVKMPTEVSTTPLDILVQNNPGSQDAPVVAGGDGAYYEVLERPFRIPVLAAAGQAGGFVSPLRLGFSIAITPYSNAVDAVIPGMQLSASLASLSSTDTGPTIAVPAFPDPAGGPSLRLIGGVTAVGTTAGAVYVVSLFVAEAKDADRSGTSGS
jgi:hypothetical protein